MEERKALVDSAVDLNEAVIALKTALDAQPGLTREVKDAFDGVARTSTSVCWSLLGPPGGES